MSRLPHDQHITYQLQYRKCGKGTCSTCRTTQGHGPYWYAYWREGSRLRSGYIGKAHPIEEGKKQLSTLAAVADTPIPLSVAPQDTATLVPV